MLDEHEPLRVLTGILKIGVKMLFARKNGVLPYFSIGTFEKGSQNQKVGVK